MKKSMSDALNTQINNELNASYAYLAMAAYFDKNGLSGLAQWFRAQSDEERTHAMRIYDYLVNRDVAVQLLAVEQPSDNFQSAEDAVSTAMAHERKVTSQINDLVALALEKNDFATKTMLDWFVAEQVEEEATMQRLLDQVQATENIRWYLMQLDEQLVKDADSVAEQPA